MLVIRSWHTPSMPWRSRQTRFTQTNLVSDGAVPAAVTDPNLVNPWGLAAGPTSPWWVNDNGTGLSTLYNGSGDKAGAGGDSSTAGRQSSRGRPRPPRAWSSTATRREFLVNGPGTGLYFIFATEDGTISGWNPPARRTKRGLEGRQLEATGAVYKGLALANNGGADFLYATNFHAGTVDVFDSSFQQVTLASGAFTDPGSPRDSLRSGSRASRSRAPHRVLFVTYAKQDADKHDDVAGRGHGFVDVFDTSGNLLQRVASRGHAQLSLGHRRGTEQLRRSSATSS